MTQRLLLSLLIVLCISTLPAVESLACHCYFNSPEIEFMVSDAVFIGTILLIQPSSDPDILDILVQVTGFWKGVGISYVHLYTNESDGACGYNFDLATEYLIYARTYSQECCEGLVTDLCTRTTTLSGATQDLEFLGPPGTVPVDNVTWGIVKTAYE
jgi:hypothetical protein